jgi:AraC-like DNA-binding protein
MHAHFAVRIDREEPRTMIAHVDRELPRSGQGGAGATIAPALGYESESSFGKAFRRVIGETPGRFAREPMRATVAG